MKEYEFTLKFTFPNGKINPEFYLEKLSEAGCDDAIIGIGQEGRIALDFNREATDALSAIVSAIEAVKKAIPEARLIESSPDLVGLTDIANLFGFSRQNMRKLVHSNIASFPQPVHAGKSSIWHLHNVLDWFEKDQKRHICASTKEISHAEMQVNIAKESSNSVKESQAELSRLAL